MPMYSFRCKKCGKQFEELLSMKDASFAVCPECGGEGERHWMGKQNHVSSKSAPACPMAESCGKCCPHSH